MAQEKKTRRMAVLSCPANRLDEIKEIFKNYCEDEKTITVEPVVYKVTGEVLKDNVMDFYKDVDRIDKELENNEA